MVSKEVLIKAVWPKPAVKDGDLNVQVAALRVLARTSGRTASEAVETRLLHRPPNQCGS